MPASLTLRSQSELTFASINPSSSKPCTSSLAACHVKPRSLPSGSISSLSSFGSRFALPERTESPLCWGSHCLYACGFRIYFTPLPGFFSPFPHGTGSLSVDYEYLALEDGPPIFRQDFTCPALLVATPVPHLNFRVRGYHPLWPDFPDCSTNKNAKS